MSSTPETFFHQAADQLGTLLVPTRKLHADEDLRP